MTTDIQTASQPCCRIYSGTPSSSVEHAVVCWCYTVYDMDWLLLHLQPSPSTSYSLHQRVWNQVLTDTVQHKCVQPNLLYKCSPTLEHFASWHLPAVTRQLQSSTEHHPADVNTSQPCFNPPHRTVFIGPCVVFICTILLLHTASTAHTCTGTTVRHYSASSWHLTWTNTKTKLW